MDMVAEDVADSVFGDLADWQAMLDRHDEVFSGMLPGAAVGFVPRAGSGIQPGKHVAGLVAANGAGDMMVWQIVGTRMQASMRRYTGFQECKVDLLFVTEDEAVQAMHETLQDGNASLSVMKRQIRKGSIMFYVMRTKYELQDAGYEEFLDTLGLAFLGACR